MTNDLSSGAILSNAPDPETMPLNGKDAPSRRIGTVLAFFALTFGLSWGLAWASTLLAPNAPVLAEALFALCGFGPSLAALIVVLACDGIAGLGPWLRRCLTWRMNVGWYALAFVAPPLVMLTALGLHGLLGGALPVSPAVGHPGLALVIFAQILLVGGPLGEEFGWRGYALPVLAGRYGWRNASLVIGVVWGIWHAPLFLIAGTPQSQMPPLLFLLGTIAMSVGFGRLAINTGYSILPAIVLHWSINAGAWTIPVTPQGDTMRPYLLVIGVLAMVAGGIFLKPGPKPLPTRLGQ